MAGENVCSECGRRYEASPQGARVDRVSHHDTMMDSLASPGEDQDAQPNAALAAKPSEDPMANQPVQSRTADLKLPSASRKGTLSMSVSLPSQPIDPKEPPSDETTRCPDCAEIIRAKARKCRFCGRHVDTDIETQSVSGGLTSAISIGEVDPSGRLQVSGRGVVVVTCLVLAVVAASVGAWRLLDHASVSRHTVTGTFALTDSSSDYTNYPVGHYCSGENGYNDIAAGAEVQVLNQAGTILGTSALQGGSDAFTSCNFTFSVPQIPSAAFYQIQVSHRGNVTFSKAELQSNHWTADLTLGS